MDRQTDAAERVLINRIADYRLRLNSTIDKHDFIGNQIAYAALKVLCGVIEELGLQVEIASREIGAFWRVDNITLKNVSIGGRDADALK